MEAWTLIVGTLAGFITAFLAEPVKMYFASRNEKIKLRKAIYRELSYLYAGWYNLVNLVESRKVDVNQVKENVESVMQIDCYAYAKSKPVVFYSLTEATNIDKIYGNYQLAEKVITQKGGAEGIPYAQGACHVFEKYLRENSISQKLLFEVATLSERDKFSAILAQNQLGARHSSPGSSEGTDVMQESSLVSG